MKRGLFGTDGHPGGGDQSGAGSEKRLSYLIWIKYHATAAASLERESFPVIGDELERMPTVNEMRKPGLSIVAITALSVGMLFAATDTSSAQQQAAKRLTYEQAWAYCKQQVTSVLGTDATTTAGRYTRGAACMKQQGYRLKKSSQ
jgi:hypothetical protein